MGNEENRRKRRIKTGVFIPLTLWLDEELSVSEKIILIEIYKDGEVRNEYLSRICQSSESQITKLLAQLIKMGFICGEGKGDMRILSISTPYMKKLSKNGVFDGVFIPLTLWDTQLINPILKFLLVEISQFDGDGCTENNMYFSKLLRISESQVSRLVSQLVKLQLVSTSIIRAGRKIYLNAELEHFFNPDIQNHVKHTNEPIASNSASKVSQIFNHLFLDFWEKYPNKNRGDIRPRETYHTVVKSGIGHDQIMQNLERCKLSKHWVKGHIPLATVWLNQEFL